MSSNKNRTVGTFTPTENRRKIGTFTPTDQRSYDPTVVYRWENENKKAFDTLEQYRKKINDGGYLSADDLSAYQSAIDVYTKTASDLRNLSKRLGQKMTTDDRSFSDSMASLRKNATDVSDYYSKFENEAAYKEAYEANKLYQEQLSADLGQLQTDMDALSGNIKKMEDLVDKYHSVNGHVWYEGQEEDLAAVIAEMQKVAGNYWAGNTPLTIVGTMKGALTEKEQYYNLSERYQSWKKLADVVTNEDFQEKSQRIGPPQGEDYDKWYENNYDEWYDPHNDVFGHFDYMTEEQKAIYIYHYNTGGEEAADAYDASIKDDQNKRWADSRTALDKGSTMEALNAAFAAALGNLGRQVKGAWNMITGSEEYIPISGGEYYGANAREELADNGPELFGSSLGQMAYDFLFNTARQAPARAIGALTGPVGGVFALGVGAAGNAYADMINAGYGKSQARTYAALVGGSEAGLSYLLDALPQFGGKLSNKLISSTLDKIDNVLARVAIQLSGKFGSEAFEEGLQAVLDPWWKQIATNIEQDKADWEDVAYESLLGGLSGLIMGGPEVVVNAVNTTNTGHQLLAQGVTAQDLVAIGTEFDVDSPQYALAQRVRAREAAGKKTSAYTMGRMWQEFGGEMTAQNTAVLTQELRDRGFSQKQAKDLAGAFANLTAGKQLTRAQAKAMENSKELASAVREVLLNQETQAGRRMQTYNAVSGKLEGASQDTTKSATATAKEGPKISKDGQTYRTDTGEAVESLQIESVGNGKITYNMGDKVVDKSEIEYANAQEAMLHEAMSKSKTLTVRAANFMAQHVDPQNPSYINEAIDSYQAGWYGYSESKLDSFTMPKSQSYELYAYGKKARQEYDTKQKQAQSQAQAATEVGTKAKGTSGVYFTDMKGHTVAFDEAKQHLTPKQKAGVDTAKFLNELGLGGEFVFFRSERINGEWMFRDSKGNLHNAPNGMYTGKDGRIYIDLNTFAGSRGATLYTLAHELTHFIENNAPEQYKVLADFLINEYDKTGKSMDERVKDKQKELEYLWDREVSYDEAFHEVVADSMQKLFNDGNLQNELVKLKQSGPEGAKVVQAIKDFLDKLIKRIRSIYAKLATGSVDAETVAQMGESLQKLQKIFAAALVEASDNYTAYGAVDSGTVQMQARQDTASGYGGIREVLAKKGLDELSKKLGDRFPLSAAFDATMRADKTPLVMETVLVNGVQRAQKESAFAAGKRAFRAAYGSKTSVHIKQMGIDADLYVDVAKESIDKAQGKPDEQSTLDVIPHIRNILENSILMGMERIAHTDNKGTVLYGYRLYNLYWYQNGNKKTPNCLVCTVVQNLDKAEGYVFQNIENVTVRHGLPGENTGMPEPSNGNIYTVSQLYDAVKKIDRENGGLKYSDVQRDKYLFNYTERNDGVSYQVRPSEETSNRYLLTNALESAAQTDEERQKLQQYREQIQNAEDLEDRLDKLNRRIFEYSFAPGPRDTAKLNEMRETAKRMARQLDRMDKRLLGLEATKPMKGLLERERKLERQRTAEKYREASQRRTEGRQKTEMRHKVQKAVKKLNDLLLHESKDKHIPERMKSAVAEILDSINMDTVDAESRIRELEAQLEEAMKAGKAELVQDISRRIDNIRNAGDRLGERIKKLHEEYEKIREDTDPVMQNAYDEGLSAYLMPLVVEIGDTPLRSMTLEQLQAVYDVCTSVSGAISKANENFLKGIGATVEERAIAAMEEIARVGGSHRETVSALDGVKGFGWSLLKPIYAMRAIGSKTLTWLYENIRKGEDVWAVDVTEARDFYRDMVKKYGYDGWDMKKQYTFQSTTGREFQLNLEQIMSLYALSKREKALPHLQVGGFVYDSDTKVVRRNKLGIPVEYTINTADAHNLSAEILAKIVGTLTKEQQGFVEEMQSYLSNEMAQKGNTVSMALYDLRLFKEKNYFPLRSADQYLQKKNEPAGHVKLKNAGFSKKTTPRANNPIVLGSFTEVWSEHVNDMSMYHAFVLPIEDFNRVYNFNSGKADENVNTESVKGAIQNAYGSQANKYISKLLEDINGGARSDPDAGAINKLVGLHKKGAVYLSASVVIQQPSAIARAEALIDAKYFAGPKIEGKRRKATWEEVKKWAPVALIKEMGRFDMNMGKSTVEYIKGKEYDTFGEKIAGFFKDQNYRDDILSRAPALADEISWCYIWNAVKRETADKNPGLDTSSNEFFQKAGERFTEVITRTQVYDSVLSRSQMMRSKDTGVKMITAFYAEPNTSMNMAVDAVLQHKRGVKGGIRRTWGAVIASQILNSFLVSLVYAARDDDEDETYLEKYVGRFTAEVLDSFNPMGYLPILRDILSVSQGYTVERSDMTIVGDVFDAIAKLSNKDLSVWKKTEGLIASVSQFTGIPVKNLLRDGNALYNLFYTGEGISSTTARGVWQSIVEEVTRKDISNARQLYSAVLAGDENQTDRVLARYEDQDAAITAFQSVLRDEFEDGKIEGNEAVQILVEFADLKKEDAEVKVDYWKTKYQTGVDLTLPSYSTWYRELKDKGVTLEVFEDFKKRSAEMEGDKDKNGETISGSKKKKIIALIDSLPIPDEQKDALYLSCDYAKSTLNGTPWH